MSDSKYFTGSKGKGEVYEWKEKLNSTKVSDQRDGIKKVIAAMTTGSKDKDVQALFNDVIKLVMTDNLELKKLAYLYIMNYARVMPTEAIMAVNSFVEDTKPDKNPLIRALAVRTMGCLRVDTITTHLCEPLRVTLKDEDPYVRKTAAVCVAKLYDIDPTVVKDQGFIEMLQELLSDSNPMVVANAVAALSEMHEIEPGAGIFDMSASTVSKLLTALSECTEWGQIFILDSLAIYQPKDQREIKSICDRVAPRLQHVNAAVVLSAVKVVMKLMEGITDAEKVAELVAKLAPPLVTLLSAEPEVQYVALRNINLIVQKRPEALVSHMKVFFVKYNDPIYVKLEKLDVMIRLASPSNITQVLSELKEYATEVDVDFVRKSVRAIGRCAIKIESQAQRCVDTLVDLIETKVNYVVQEAIIVIKDIFRKYPNKYESIIAKLCENLESLDEPEAKAAMIWIVGEYADRIDNADELLESFLDNFVEESPQVQLALITGTVKLFLKRPSGTQELVQRILILATQECDNPDLRDRGFIYWRLLLTDPAAAKAVVLAEKPLISEETDMLEPSLLDELICHISSLASVYHKPPSTFVESSAGGRVLAGAAAVATEVDLIGEDMPEMLAVAGLPAGGGVDLLLGGLGGTTGLVKAQEVYCTAEAGGGLEITGAAAREDDQLVFKLTLTNKTAAPITDVKFKFNNNSFKLEAAAHNVASVPASGAIDFTLQMTATATPARMTPLNKLQVAFVKNGAEGFTIFDFLCPYYCLLDESGRVDAAEFATKWGGLAAHEHKFALSNIKDGNVAVLAQICDANNVFKVGENAGTHQLAMKFMNGLVVLAELSVAGSEAQITLRTEIHDLFASCTEIFTDLIVNAPLVP